MNGEQILFDDGNGDIYHYCEPLDLGSMCLPVNWNGRGGELFLHNPNPVHGGMFDGCGRHVLRGGRRCR